jgi:hypothetical protein
LVAKNANYGIRNLEDALDKQARICVLSAISAQFRALHPRGIYVEVVDDPSIFRGLNTGKCDVAVISELRIPDAMAGVYNEQACAKETAKEEGWETESGCRLNEKGGESGFCSALCVCEESWWCGVAEKDVTRCCVGHGHIFLEWHLFCKTSTFLTFSLPLLPFLYLHNNPLWNFEWKTWRRTAEMCDFLVVPPSLLSLTVLSVLSRSGSEPDRSRDCSQFIRVGEPVLQIPLSIPYGQRFKAFSSIMVAQINSGDYDKVKNRHFGVSHGGTRLYVPEVSQ